MQVICEKCMSDAFQCKSLSANLETEFPSLMAAFFIDFKNNMIILSNLALASEEKNPTQEFLYSTH